MIFGFKGRAESGKGTLYRELRNREWESAALTRVLGCARTSRGIVPIRREAFAHTLKVGAQAIYGLSDEQMSDPVLKNTVDPRWGLTPRQMLQGMDELKRVHPKVYVLPTLERIRNAFESTAQYVRVGLPIVRVGQPIVCVTDLRHIAEFEGLRELAESLGQRFTVVEVLRQSRAPQSTDGHRSETEMDLIPSDFVIENDTTPGELAYHFLNKLTLHLHHEDHQR